MAFRVVAVLAVVVVVAVAAVVLPLAALLRQPVRLLQLQRPLRPVLLAAAVVVAAGVVAVVAARSRLLSFIARNSFLLEPQLLIQGRSPNFRSLVTVLFSRGFQAQPPS
jgi:ABC-type sugar transport system permease subunit